MELSKALKRRKQNKVDKVMGEYKAETLHNGSGGIVKNRRQALAIAIGLSEAGLSKKR